MRKAKPKKRIVLPDPIFGDVMVTRFVNHLMYDGKKSVAEKILSCKKLLNGFINYYKTFQK